MNNVTDLVVDLMNRSAEGSGEPFKEQFISYLEAAAGMDTISFVQSVRQHHCINMECGGFLESCPFYDVLQLPQNDIGSFTLAMLKLSDQQRSSLFLAWAKILRER